MENERKRLMEEEWNSMIPTHHQLSHAHFPPNSSTLSCSFPTQFPLRRRYFCLSAEWGNGVIGEKAASSWLYVVPWGLRKILNYIAQKYNTPPIYITENGMDDEDNDASPLHEMLDDKLRIAYYKGYLTSVSLAIKDGVHVKGYFAWSLVDNFEWPLGYTKRFGLIYIDYKNGLTRHRKSSAYWFMKFFKGEDGKNGKED